MLRVFDSAGPGGGSRFIAASRVAFPLMREGRRPGFQSISELHGWPALPPVNASLMPCGMPRMTRGHDGSLLLSCEALSSSIRRRFIPALPHLGSASSSRQRLYRWVSRPCRQEACGRQTLERESYARLERILSRLQAAPFCPRLQPVGQGGYSPWNPAGFSRASRPASAKEGRESG